MFELWLFTTDPDFAKNSLDSGVTGIFIDWEYIGKEGRQIGANLECNHDSVDDLKKIHDSVQGKIICRLNPFGLYTADEVNKAISAGADVLMLPMVRTPEEVKEFLEIVNERAECGILIETKEGIIHAPAISHLPLDYIYVGLNDLAVSRKSPNIFIAISDGTVRQLREIFMGKKFGFGGITVIDKGSPIAFHLLLKEMVALNCDFSFLRRSYKRDIQGRDQKTEIDRIYRAIEEYKKRDLFQIQEDRKKLNIIIDTIGNQPINM